MCSHVLRVRYIFHPFNRNNTRWKAWSMKLTALISSITSYLLDPQSLQQPVLSFWKCLFCPESYYLIVNVMILSLRSIGYSEVASTAVKSFHPLSSVIIDPEEESSNMPRPDFTQMIPFKPKAQAIPGDHPVPGMFANINMWWWVKLLLNTCTCETSNILKNTPYSNDPAYCGRNALMFQRNLVPSSSSSGDDDEFISDYVVSHSGYSS